MRVSELTGAQLDYWVAKAEGWECGPMDDHGRYSARKGGASANGGDFAFTTDWAQGGEIIERERIGVAFDGGSWVAAISDGEYESYFHLQRSTARTLTGPTPLIAAMRAYVACKFGEKVG